MIFPTLVFSQKKNRYLDEILLYQAEQNKEFKDPETSPLEKKDLKKFKSLAFYPIDSSFRIKARFVETPGQTPFAMPTTTNRKPIYQKFGEAHFTLEGESITLNLYQSHDLKGSEEYHDYLFLPFTDETNGKETYGGGRYLGLHIPEGDSIIIDFNKAYNPYCAYNAKYSCPIVPKENNIPEEIRAGVKAFKHK
ncbi:MAG: DUF1684 domain-containing protein [Candidatus Cyclobacteriaceae bacterium M2_1C_046]